MREGWAKNLFNLSILFGKLRLVSIPCTVYLSIKRRKVLHLMIPKLSQEQICNLISVFSTEKGFFVCVFLK